jgi:hypothetical protein
MAVENEDEAEVDVDEALVPEEDNPSDPMVDRDLGALDEELDELLCVAGLSALGDSDIFEGAGLGVVAGHDGQAAGVDGVGGSSSSSSGGGVAVPGAPEGDGLGPGALRVLPPRPTFDQLMVVPGGIIKYYQHDNRFVAECVAIGHGRCVLTRGGSKASPAKGRPLGLFMAWLTAGEHPDCDCLAKHWAEDRWPSLADRQRGRAALWDLLGGPELMACERARHGDEPEEPINAK